MRINPAKQKLQQGETVIGHIVMEFASPALAKVLADVGLDFVLFDTEHTRFSIETVCGLLRHAQSVGLPAFVRVPRGQYDQMSRYMDAGADGIMVPNVESPEEAERIVQATKYAPIGDRGTAFGIAQDDFEIGDIVRTMQAANERTLLIAQIESECGVDNVDAIMTTEGVDVGWIGHNDLSQSMGIPGQFDHPTFGAAIDTVLSACERCGKAAGRSAGSPETIVELTEQGFRCLSYGSDMRVYRAALMDAIRKIQE